MKGLRALPVPCMLLLAACTLTETTLADAEDSVIIELVLRAGAGAEHRAFVYRTVGTAGPSAVPGVLIEVSDAAGRIMTFAESATRQCIDDGVPGPLEGTCYVEQRGPVEVLPGATYSLRATLRDGGVITGVTTVPGDFAITTPHTDVCRIAPGTTIDLHWSPAEGSWVYVAEAELGGLAVALASQGIELDEDPLRLLGLAISREDTTLAFPTGFGLFDRADPAVADALIAIRGGLPPEVRAGVVIAAADRNYVNWVRGGNFNPSGLVRVPSVRGDGTGVFGSLVVRSLTLTTVTASTAEPCQ